MQQHTIPPEVLEQVRHGGACPRRIHARPEMGELLDQSFYDLRPAHLELNEKRRLRPLQMGPDLDSLQP